MKKITAIFLCIIMILSFAACGDEGGTSSGGTSSGESSGNTSSGNVSSDVKALEEQYSGLTKDSIEWDYNSSTKTVIISGEGPMKDYLDAAPEWDKYATEAEHVVIGDEVTSVGAGAFLYFTELLDADLGNAVEFIGGYAFSNCIKLRGVKFPASLKYVGSYAFNNALLHSDSGFVFPEGMLFLGESSFRSAFKDSFVSVPASLTCIESDAFTNCFVEEFRVDPANPSYASENGVLYDKGLTTLINYPADKRDTTYEIPGSVTTILSEAIAVTNTLEKIAIPASVSEIEEASIYWNYGLKEIVVDENNANYKSEGGVLYTADGKLLLCYPIACDRTEYTVLEGCERICDYALSQAANLTELHTNEGLKTIGSFSFYLCEKLSQLGLPKSLETIDTFSFMYCDALKRIDFTGSSSDWDKVKIDEHNEPLTGGSVQIYCAE